MAAPFLVEPLLCRGFEEALEHGGHLDSRGLALGVRVLSLVPFMMPAPQAHCMGEIAYSLKSPKSA